MIEPEKEGSREEFWRCKGRGENWPIEDERFHLEEILTSDKCPKCGRSRPPHLTSFGIASSNASINSRSQTDWRLLTGLIILNLVSGYTTMQGAAQILPRFAGYLAGATIQSLLFLLLSHSTTLPHRPKLKWTVIIFLTFFSVYTSFFAYYKLLTAETQTASSIDRARSAHQNLVSTVFIPIKNKSSELKNEIKRLDILIKAEEEGRRASGLEGCGDICKKLEIQKESVLNRYAQVRPVNDNLEPFFQYDLISKDAQTIFQLDLKAIAQVTRNCLPSEPAFVCLPENFESVLDPKSPKYKQLRSTYFDEDLAIGLLTPFLKIRKLDVAAIGAAIFTLLIDGCIIILGLGVEARQKPRKLSLQITGLGSTFLDNLLESIDSSTLIIDFESLRKTENRREYLNLLQNIRAETNWLSKVDEEQRWQMSSNDAEEKFNLWLVKQRQEQVRIEIKSYKKPTNTSQHRINISLQLPTRW